MALQVSYTDPNTGDEYPTLYLRYAGHSYDALVPTMSTITVAAFSTRAQANAGRNPRFIWRVPVAQLGGVGNLGSTPVEPDLTDLNTLFGVPIKQPDGTQLVASPGYNALLNRIYTWLKSTGASRLNIDLSGATDV